MSYLKHFGEQSSQYQQFRPTYPKELFEYLFTLVKTFDLAVDCATGNGQAALELASRFNKVIGIDLNREQLDFAEKRNNIEYKCMDVEHTDIADHSVDLITIAQALHWFHFDEFYKEMNRISKSGSIIAAWSYSLGQITPTIDAIISKLYSDLENGYWPKERFYIDQGYRSIPFPFKKIMPPVFTVEKQFSFPELIGYLNTWSAIKEFRKRNNKNPIDDIYLELQKVWGTADAIYIMRWPLHMLVGRIE